MDEFKEDVEFENILNLYKEVFDEEGNVRHCGRDKCRELIIALNTYYEEVFGNVETGMMDVKKIKEYI